jgi:hypothetical protein
MEFREVHIGVCEYAFECVTINFVVEREHYPSSVRMFHLDVAASAMNLHEARRCNAASTWRPESRRFRSLLLRVV